MDTIDELLTNNRTFAEPLADRHLEVEPSRHLAIVTCMDSRLDVFAALGLGGGEAHVLRNAGGVVSDDVIRSLAISQRRLGTREIMLIHHTDCGMEKISDEGFRVELEEATGIVPEFPIESFERVDDSVRRVAAARPPLALHPPPRSGARLRLRRRHAPAARGGGRRLMSAAVLWSAMRLKRPPHSFRPAATRSWCGRSRPAGSRSCPRRSG